MEMRNEIQNFISKHRLAATVHAFKLVLIFKILRVLDWIQVASDRDTVIPRLTSDPANEFFG